MVRTRHSGDIDAVESPKFLTLDDERDTNKYDTSKRDKCYASSQLRGAYHDDDEYNIFEDKVMNSRLRPRTGPGRAYNYLDADSSDDDQARLHKRQASHMEIQGHFQSSRTIKQEMFEELEQTTRRKSSRQAEIQNDDDDVSCMIRRRSLRQTRQPLQPRESHSRKRYTRRSGEVIGSDHKDEENEDTENEGTDDEQKDQDQDDTDNEGQNNFSDMYSRVKRTRLRHKRDIYETDNDKQNRNNNQAEETDEEEERVFTRRSERKAKKKPPEIVKSYSLREHKPRTDLYKAPVEERRIKKNTNNIFEVTPTKKTGSQPYQSPAQRRKTKKRSAIHSSSSSTSSSSGESNDEKSFKKRKAKSMAKARSRMRPMNFTNTDPASGVVKDRVKSGASLADVEPMNIDKNVTFESIGGLGKHIRSLKEMVVFPLLYDKVFQKFNVDPPRGVLFYGPPGTGKTLVARALANECSHGDKRVAFFMRKGADCLSKWVGESERQLRLLFDQAYKYRPSIIFFDEIDGLAPVRSSRQDQIHSSIVSTLLALMDGLDSRGEIVVIGATNRIDSLDPALRRPGRFDREFLFSLPSLEARKQILKIHTDKWNPKLNDLFITELAEKCVGYCGADLKSLCTEATMMALRRRYPQIYMSNDALQLDLTSINVCAKDFFNAMRNIIPTSRRSVNAPGRPLSLQVVPLLARQLDKALTQLSDSFPPCLHKTTTSNNSANATNSEMMWEDLPSDEDENAPSIFVTPASKSYKSQQRMEQAGSSKELNPYLNFTRFSTLQPWTFRPRILLTGVSGQGQTSYIAPAMIHRMEDLPVHVLDLPALYAVTAKTPEESCANVFHEAKRKCPSIIYMPYINQWWGVLGDTLRTTLLTLIQDLDPSTPLLLLATSEQPYSSVDPELQLLFSETSSEVFKMMNPNSEEREHYFKELLLQHSCKAPAEKKGIGQMIKLMEQRTTTNFLSNNLGLHKSYYLGGFSKDNKQQTFTDIKKVHMRNVMNSSFVRLPTLSVRSNIHAFQLPAKKSTHKMRLRSRQIVLGRNNNHLIINKDLNNYCSINCFRKSIQCSTRYLRSALSSCSNLSRIESLRRMRVKLRLIQKNTMIHAVPNAKNCTNANCSNNHLNYSCRQWRYLRRQSLTHSEMKITKPGLRSKHSLFLNSSKRLSCGSTLMLNRENCTKSTFHGHCDPAMPINLIQLTKKFTFSSYEHESEISTNDRKPSIRYNLRSQSSCISSGRELAFQNHQKTDISARKMLEVLPKAVPVAPKELTNREIETLLEKEELTLMELRIFLRDVLHKLGSDKKFSIFAKAVNIEDAPDYYEVIESPMDLSSMMCKIDCHDYGTVRSFVDDIDLICSNALEYNPDRGPMDRVIRHRACALKDTAYAIIKTELDKDFEKMCVEIQESRKRRGIKSTTVPSFVRTKPPSQNAASTSKNVVPNYLDFTRPPRSIPEPEGQRYSRRVRGLNIDLAATLEDVEKTARVSHASPSKDQNECAQNSSQMGNSSDGNESATQEMEDDVPEGANDSIDSVEPKCHTDPVKKSIRKNRCVWCRPSRKRRKLYQTRFLPSITKKLVQRAVTQVGKKEKGIKSSHSPSVDQPLNIDITAQSESEDLKSPVRKSTRLVSPSMSTGGVTTRRQSLSPRIAEVVDVLPKDPPQEKTIPEKDETVPPSIAAEKPQCEKDNEQSGVSNFLEKTVESLKEIESQPDGKKAAAVKRLDLDFVAVDSGAGSSLDGNGDSRDSMDKLEEAATSVKPTHQAKDLNQNNERYLTEKAGAVLNESQPKLIVSAERLSMLLDRLVQGTEGCNVEHLEKIYSQLSQIIYKHRHAYDRTEMMTELERKVTDMT